MLIFKKNIYSASSVSESPVRLSPPALNPYNFIRKSLGEEDGILQFIGKQPQEYRAEDMKNFYPNACKCVSWPGMVQMVRILSEGLECRSRWYQMNTYHFCVLYDILNRNAFNYNHDMPEEKKLFLPDLGGGDLDFVRFLEDYFFNRVFLLEPDRYNALSQSEKQRLGFTCPCQFGVVNGLIPNREEMALSEARENPYVLRV